MRKLIYIFLLLGITVQAQFTMSVGVVANQDVSSPEWKIDGMTGLAISVDLNPTTGGSFTGLAMSPDGTTMLTTTDASSDDVTQWNLPTPYDVTSILTGGTAIDLSGLNGGNPSMQSIEYNNDGTKAYIADLGLDGITQFSLSTPYDFTTQTFDGEFDSTQTKDELMFQWRPDGDRFFIGQINSDDIDEFSVSTSWDVLSTVTHIATHTMTGGDWTNASDPHSMQWFNDGFSVLIRSTGGLYQHDMTTAYDLSTNTFVYLFDINTITGTWMSGATLVDQATGVLYMSRYDATQTIHKTQLNTK